MNITLPLLVEEFRRPGAASPIYRVRPLFFPGPLGHGDHLSRAIARLTAALRKHLEALGKKSRHDELIRWIFSPPITEQFLNTRLILTRGTVECRVLVASFDALDRRLAMMPVLPGRWFEVTRGQKMLDRAAEILTDHLNGKMKESDKFKVPDDFTAKRRQWISTLDMNIDPEPALSDGDPNALLAILGGTTLMTGQGELHKVGRNLDSLYPDELDRPVLRDSEVTELENLLAGKERRPILILGETQVGKTAILHECVFRRVQKARAAANIARSNIWLLSPQRLISGMMYIGQWENRVTAIVDEAIKRDHVLYFDDVIGLFFAGRSRDSDLTVAHVIKPYIERRDFRMLIEMTPAAFRQLQERDRGFADLFHVLPVRPTPEDQTRQILFDVRRQLEGEHKCEFDLDVLPLVLDLGNRYLREAAQPGKSAQFYRLLATKFSNRSVSRWDVLEEFHARSGLALEFLDAGQRLRREEIVQSLTRNITGQEEAVAAMADTVMVAKARLNDPARPLGTFLFLGPTGVGKTQCAKALAKYLFGDEKRMLRFDMNEYLDGAATARLSGSTWDPEGLLTAAIRQQPFSVVLLDEIEKAHPSVFDLLLQVLGEGRLTDSLGRTADFGNAIIIMTSNLGARQAGATFGLRTAGKSERDTYIQAAEQFFRPEFFNRIDRIVPFQRLTRPQIGQIAERLITDILKRDGLVHRQCVLAVDPAALEKVVDEGYHPQLGARALKRAVERQLTQPVAAHLASAKPGAPAVIHLYPAASGISVRVDTLSTAPRRPLAPDGIDLADFADVLDRAEAALIRIEQAAASTQGLATMTQGELSAAQFRYLGVREYAGHVRRFIEKLDRDTTAKKKKGSFRPSIRGARSDKKMLAISDGDTRIALRAEAEIKAHLHSLETEPQSFGDQLEHQLLQLIHETALLETMATADPAADRCLVWMRSPSAGAAGYFDSLANLYRNLFSPAHGFFAGKYKPARGDDREHSLLLEMPGIASVLKAEQGTHLFYSRDQAVVIVQVITLPLGVADPDEMLKELRRTEQQWRESIRQGAPGSDPFPLRPIIRTYDPANLTVDLRTGLASRSLPSVNEIRKFIVSQLTAPVEFF